MTLRLSHTQLCVTGVAACTSCTSWFVGYIQQCMQHHMQQHLQYMHAIVHPSACCLYQELLPIIAFLPAELDLQGASSGASFGDFTDAADASALSHGHQPTPTSWQTSAMSEPQVSGRQSFSQGSLTMPWSKAPLSDGAPFGQGPAMLSLPQASNGGSATTSSWPQQHREMSSGSWPAATSFLPTHTALKDSFEDICDGGDGFGDFAAADHGSTNASSQVQTSQQHAVAAADRSALLFSTHKLSL